MGPRPRRLADAALTASAVLGALALLAAALAAVTGVRPLFFRSGSMAPAIGTGSLGLARSVPAAELRRGDIVSVTSASGLRVTHRVVRIEGSAGRAVLTLRGDANRIADSETYTVDSAYRVFWHVPWLGYAVGWMASPVGLVMLALTVLGLLVLVSGKGSAPPGGGRRARREPRPRARRSRRAASTAAATIAVLACPAQVGPAWSTPWTDPVTVSGTTLVAETLPAPSLSCSALGAMSVTFAWTAVSGATSYTIHYGIGGAQTMTTTSRTITFVAGVSGGIAWVEAHRDFGSVVWTSAASNTRTYTVAVVSLCG